MEFLRKLLTPPDFGDKEKNRIGNYVHWLSVSLMVGAALLGVVNALGGHPHTLSIGMAAVVVLAGGMVLLRKGWVKAASLVVLVTGWGSTTLALATGSGIHDIAIMLYPILVVVASFLMQRRGTLLMSVLVAISAGLIIAGEMLGFVNTPKTVSTDFVDWVTITLIILIGAITIGYMSDTLNHAVRLAHESELAYAKSNRELARQAELIGESEERWRALIQNAPDNILNIDLNGKILLINLLDESVQQMVGRSVFDITPPEEHDTIRSLMAEIIKTGNPAQHEGYAYSSGGEKRWYAMRIAPIKDKHGKVSSLTIIATDISDRLVVEQTLTRRAQQLTTLNKIGQAVSSLRDINGVLSVVFEEMSAILPLDIFFVALYDKEKNQVSYPLMYDSGRFWEQPSLTVDQDSSTGRVIQLGKPLLENHPREVIAELEKTHQFRPGDKSRVSVSIVAAPLILDGQVVGVVAAHSYDFDVYTQEHLDLLTGASYQIAIALQNARLYEGLQQRAAQLASLNEISLAVTTLQDLDTTLDLIQEQLQKVIQMDALQVALYDPATNMLSFPLMYDSGQRWHNPPVPINPATVNGKVIQTGKSFLINRTPEEIAEREKHIEQRLGNLNRVSASMMFVPMQIGGQRIGIVSAHSYELNAYKESDVSLLEGAAIQIGIAIQNARLYENTRKHAEQLTALNQIGSGISALQNLDQALQITLAHMQKILSLDVFYIGLYNGQHNTLSFPLMYDSGKLWNEPETTVDPGGWIETVLVTRRPFLLNRTPDQMEAARNNFSLGDVTRASASIMIAPMELDTRFIGVVSVQSYSYNAYTQEDLLLLGNAAGQIAIAVENARLYQEAKHRAEIMTTLYHLANVITSNLHLDGVMNELYESCNKLLPLNAFYLATYDEETGIIAHPIFIDQGKRVKVPSRNIKDRPGLSGHIITQKQTVYIPDVLDPQARETYQIIHIGGDPTRSYLGVPLLHTEKPIGVISVQNDRPHAFTAEHVSLLETISTQAAIALVNARLYEDKQRELNERLQAEETVRTLNAELEKRVQERTAELQSFTYTVSHDLRAPLRSINGYSRIFLEDYGSLIPEEGHILLERISNGARQMGILIDDLLTFSRLNRASLNKTVIDLTRLVRDILDELTEHEDKSRIEWRVNDLPPAHADPALIRQALTNLLSNALKFTRHRERALIEVGSQDREGATVYFVKDNGAGFSMDHANKLFGVFQRLHHQEEFEGTGVGLAIVQRIIQQHGGRIWAEAQLNQGATFYFTLGAPPDVIN